MSPIGKEYAAPIPWRTRIGRQGGLQICLLLIIMTLSACSTTNPESTFDPETGQHPANWSNPLSIGHFDFHADQIKMVQSASRGAVLFGLRCASCHGSGGMDKTGHDIRDADENLIAAAIAFIPIMRGLTDLSPGDVQEIAAYLATLLAGDPPAASVIRTDNCTDCHGVALDGGISAISCFSCHNGPDGSIGHPAGWFIGKTDPVHFHGSYGRKFNRSCTACHGASFEGAIGRPCASCHNGSFAPILDFIPAGP